MKENSVEKKNLPVSLSRSVAETVSSEKTAAALKKLLFCAAYMLLSFCLSGTEVFPGTYPLGIALLSSVSGPAAVISSFAGTIFGSARTGGLRGIYILVCSMLLAVRIGISFWLESDSRTAKTEHRANAIYNKWKETRDIRIAFTELSDYLKSAYGTALHENIRIRLALSACAALFAGAWSVISGGYVYYDLFGALFSLFITPLFTYLIYAAISHNMRASRLREIGVCFLCAAVSLALHGMSPLPLAADQALIDAGIAGHSFTFDFGVLAAFTAVTLITVGFGMYRGALCGILCGAVLTPVYAPAYALAAIACSFLSPYSETVAVLVSGTLASAWGIFAGGFDGLAVIFPPIVAACALLIPAYRLNLIHLPEDMFLSESSVKKRGDMSVMAHISSADILHRTQNLSEGLSSVASVLSGVSERLTKPDSADMREIVESVFTFHCSTCKNRGSCSEARTPSPTPLVRRMTDCLTKFGVISADTVPSDLASECWNMGRILDEINLTVGHKIAALSGEDKLSVTADDYSLAASMLSSAAKCGSDVSKTDEALTEKLRPLIAQKDFSASSAIVYGDRFKHIFIDGIDVNTAKLGADDIRAMFESAAGCRLSPPEFSLDGDNLSMKMVSLPSLSCASGSFSRAASDETLSDDAPFAEVYDVLPESICGDVITSFEADGRFYMILSDGMGTGKEAALTSGIAVSLLERLLESGADLESSLKMLNHIIRQAGRECSATVDIAEIDLMTGDARFIKSGAAPSFVLRDGSIFRLQSKTVPIGIIRALDAEMIRFEVKAGDTVVMVSDGAARSYDEAPWLLDLMTYDEEITKGDENAAARKIVAEARKRGSRDDVTAGIVRLKAV